MNDLIYVELSQAKVNSDVLHSFDCKHIDFNEFLYADAIQFSADGSGITYILVDKNKYNNSISIIFVFTTIQATSLHYRNEGNEDVLYSISCVEIKYFAINRRLQKQIAYDIDDRKYYITIFFELLLQDLYEISTTKISFQAIFLRANENGGKQLYHSMHRR